MRDRSRAGRVPFRRRRPVPPAPEPTAFETAMDEAVAKETAFRHKRAGIRAARLAAAEARDGHSEEWLDGHQRRKQWSQRFWRERSRLRDGTLPGDVWGEAAGREASEFMDYMTARDLAGATVLRHTFDPPAWAIRGYGVGHIEFNRLHRTRQLFNVFLCEDYRLHLFYNRGLSDHPYPHPLHGYMESPAPAFDLDRDQRPPRPATGLLGEPTDINPVLREVDRERPDIIADLPVDGRGQIMVPEIGAFSGPMHGQSLHHILSHYALAAELPPRPN